MNFALYQICLVRIDLGAANYPRPCIIIDINQNGSVAILPISTKRYDNAAYFTVSPDYPDFDKTGLKAISYIFDGPVRDAEPTSIIKIIGLLEGDLKTKFIDWIG